MELERGRLIEIGVSVSAVGLFVVVLVLIGLRYDEGGLTPDGGLVLIGAITLFVLVMGAIGIGLAYKLNPDEE